MEIEKLDAAEEVRSQQELAIGKRYHTFADDRCHLSRATEPAERDLSQCRYYLRECELRSR